MKNFLFPVLMVLFGAAHQAQACASPTLSCEYAPEAGLLHYLPKNKPVALGSFQENHNFACLGKSAAILVGAFDPTGRKPQLPVLQVYVDGVQVKSMVISALLGFATLDEVSITALGDLYRVDTKTGEIYFDAEGNLTFP